MDKIAMQRRMLLRPLLLAPLLPLLAVLSLLPATPSRVLAGPAIPPAPQPPALPAALVSARPAADVQQRLLAAVAQLPATHPRRRRYRLAVPFDAPLFPPDHLLREAPGAPADPGLEAWLALPRSQRRHDALLLPDEDYYWPDADHAYNAEHRAGAGAAEYAAQFIVHVATAGATTTLAIVQVHARRRHGKAFHLLGRAGPGFYWDIRPATPSPAAAAVLADDLALWLGATRQLG